MKSPPANDTSLTLDDIREIVPPLREEFSRTFGKDSLDKHYIQELNEDVFRNLPYNRAATLGLVAYFMATALKKPKSCREHLFRHFTEIAAQDGGGNNDAKRGHFSVSTQIVIVDAIDAKIEQGLHMSPEERLEPYAA